MRTTTTSSLTIEHALLGFIYERPMHGYEIYQQLSSNTGLWQVWRMKQSLLYAMLTKLEGEGYLNTTLQPQEARPPRKIYSLSDSGREAFLRWLHGPVPHGRQMRLEFLAKLYFAHRQGADVAGNLLDQQIVTCQAWLEEMRGQGQTEKNLQNESYFSYTVQQFRLSQIEAFLAWLSVCREALLSAVEVDNHL